MNKPQYLDAEWETCSESGERRDRAYAYRASVRHREQIRRQLQRRRAKCYGVIIGSLALTLLLVWALEVAA